MHPFSTTFIFPIGETLGGANIWSARMCGHLEQRGLATAAVMHANPGWHPDKTLPIPAGTRRLTCGGPSVIEARRRHVRAFASVYEQTLPAVFVPNFHDVTYAVCAELSRRRPADVRVIGVAHGNNDAYFGTLVKYETILHGIIAVSEEIAAELRRRLPHRAADIHTRACPVDVPTEWSRTSRESGAPIVLTYAGRITNHEKNVSQLVPLMIELDRLGVDFRFRIIGEGGYLPTLKWELSQLPEALRARASLEGLYEPDVMPSLWRDSDLCLLVSTSEGTSISMLEAMAQGCVPMVTRVSGTAAVITEGVNGYAVDVGDWPAMARHIKLMADEPSVWARASRAAHETASERYRYPDYVDWFVGLCAQWQAAAPRPWPRERAVLEQPWRWPQWMRNVGQRIKVRWDGWHAMMDSRGRKKLP
jgi:glycosyltransferase involved in cell wall biosynthesis